MLFSELSKIIVKKVTFVGFRGGNGLAVARVASGAHLRLLVPQAPPLFFAMNVALVASKWQCRA